MPAAGELHLDALVDELGQVKCGLLAPRLTNTTAQTRINHLCIRGIESANWFEQHREIQDYHLDPSNPTKSLDALDSRTPIERGKT